MVISNKTDNILIHESLNQYLKIILLQLITSIMFNFKKSSVENLYKVSKGD